MSSIFRIYQTSVSVFPYVAGLVVSGYGIYKVYRHTSNIEAQCVKISYYGNLQNPLDENTLHAIDQVTDKLLFDISAKPLAQLRFYWSNKPTIQYMGSTKSRCGTYIGIPIHYMYKNTSEVDLSTFQSDANSTGENSILIQKLRESLVLSENAKKFAITADICSANSHHLFILGDGMLMATCAFVTGQLLFEQYLKRTTVTLALVTILGVIAVWTAIHFAYSKSYYRYLRHSSDRKAAGFGEEYLEGGIEYLAKLAERNQALRELEPSTGKFMFQSNGDIIQSSIIFDDYEMPISERKNNLLKLEEERQLKNSCSAVDEETEV